MKINCFEKGFNYSQDGPGNRLVYHLQGCNMHCPWCSNPEGMEIGKVAREYTVDEMVEEIVSCSPMFFEGGGVTFTGGECTLQYRALIKVIEELRKKGISVAIESNAILPCFVDMAKSCDHVMLDYKHPDTERLRAVTGGELDAIERNISLAAKYKPLHFRIPLIHGFNDDDAALDGFVKFFKSLKGCEFDVELLPYHEYGRTKWDRCGMEYTITDGYVSTELIEKFSRMLERNNIKIIKT